MSEAKHSPLPPLPWPLHLRRSTTSVEETSYANIMTVGSHEIILGFTTEQNWTHIIKTPIAGGLVETKGVGQIIHKKKPDPVAAFIVLAVNNHAALVESHQALRDVLVFHAANASRLQSVVDAADVLIAKIKAEANP